MSNATGQRYLTPPQVAKLLSVSHQKILGWIRSGDLAGIDVSSALGGRPQWKISQAALDAFLASRTSTPPPPATRRKRNDDVMVRRYT